jgi:hypothetical protein
MVTNRWNEILYKHHYPGNLSFKMMWVTGWRYIADCFSCVGSGTMVVRYEFWRLDLVIRYRAGSGDLADVEQSQSTTNGDLVTAEEWRRCDEDETLILRPRAATRDSIRNELNKTITLTQLQTYTRVQCICSVPKILIEFRGWLLLCIGMLKQEVSMSILICLGTAVVIYYPDAPLF